MLYVFVLFVFPLLILLVRNNRFHPSHDCQERKDSLTHVISRLCSIIRRLFLLCSSVFSSLISCSVKENRKGFD